MEPPDSSMGRAASCFYLPIICFFAPSFRAGLSLASASGGRAGTRQAAANMLPGRFSSVTTSNPSSRGRQSL